MNFGKEASKLLTNKYFLYFMVFLTSTNILGYLVTNKINAVIFFALISLLTYHFSKNMSVVLLVSIVATNFMMSNKMIREGLENASGADTSGADTSGADTSGADTSGADTSGADTLAEKRGELDGEIGNAVNAMINSTASDEIKNTIQTALSSADTNNPGLNKQIAELNVPEGVGEKIKAKKNGKNENFGPRLDYAATIEESYNNLDNILGSDSIKQLSGDTQKLMQQQQNLFNTMNQMVPVLEGAQNMLKGFDIQGLTKSLENIPGIKK
mgnify:CR=1 FL=1